MIDCVPKDVLPQREELSTYSITLCFSLMESNSVSSPVCRATLTEAPGQQITFQIFLIIICLQLIKNNCEWYRDHKIALHHGLRKSSLPDWLVSQLNI